MDFHYMEMFFPYQIPVVLVLYTTDLKAEALDSQADSGQYRLCILRPLLIQLWQNVHNFYYSVVLPVCMAFYWHEMKLREIVSQSMLKGQPPKHLPWRKYVHMDNYLKIIEVLQIKNTWFLCLCSAFLVRQKMFFSLNITLVLSPSLVLFSLKCYYLYCGSS